MTPTQAFLKRLADIKGTVSTREVCRRAGVSENLAAAARSRSNSLQWDDVAAMVSVLQKIGFSREWLLFGAGPKLAGDALSGDVVRLGDGVDKEPVPGVVVPRALKKRRKQPGGAPSNDAPSASQDGRRAKRVGLSNVHNR